MKNTNTLQLKPTNKPPQSIVNGLTLVYPLIVRMYQQLEMSLKTTYKEINDQFPIHFVRTYF
jgi:hypothetical protein